jgi:translation initiation factor 2 subunit 3
MIAQAEVNIGTAGHVDHGKTTLVKALTGEWADKHSEEIKRGITIRLGYADASFYHCEKDNLYTLQDKCADGSAAKFLRTVSFVDCPGHENLMAIMLSGASMMDGAMLVIAANEPCPKPQTKEHLAALEIVGIKHIVIVQNKIDLVSKEEAVKNYQQIKEFVKGTIAEHAPIIPVAAHYGINISALIKALQEHIPTHKRDQSKDFKMVVARSFDVNKPGSDINKLKGGVIGGSIIQGVLKEGDEIEIAPGIEEHGKYRSLITKAVSLSIKGGMLKEAHPGGLVGVGTLLDPKLTKADKLVGNVVGKPGTLPQVRDVLDLDVHLIERELEKNMNKIKKGESVVVNAGTATSLGEVFGIKKDTFEIALKRPVCLNAGDKVAISRKVGSRWSLAGYGVVR